MVDAYAMECKGLNEREAQFRATAVWNMIVNAVRDELPVGKHRKGLRHIDNCFSGQEAVSWMLRYLDQHRHLLFGAARADVDCVDYNQKNMEITRDKVARLLQKFVEQNIIEEVRGRREQQFKDSTRQFYAFNNEYDTPSEALFWDRNQENVATCKFLNRRRVSTFHVSLM